MALSEEELNKRIDEDVYMGIKGSVLIENYPYLKDYPLRKRMNKMHDLALHEHKTAMLCKYLRFDPRDYCLVGDQYI